MRSVRKKGDVLSLVKYAWFMWLCVLLPAMLFAQIGPPGRNAHTLRTHLALSGYPDDSIPGKKKKDRKWLPAKPRIWARDTAARSAPFAYHPSVIMPGATERLAEAVKFKTLPLDSARRSAAAFRDFQIFLQRKFPLAHTVMRRQVMAGYSLLYSWKGSNPRMKPVLLLAHQDVVPADTAGWVHPPFSGAVSDSFVWGRGSLDDKMSILAMLESVEALAAQGFQPQRDLYFAFGHDEETDGTGAKAIARHLDSLGIKLDYVLDEGGTLLDNIIPNVDGTIALVSIAEKGYVTLELTVSDQGGHSSAPTSEGVVGILGRAIYRLQDRQFKSKLISPVKMMFRAGSKRMHGITRFVSRHPTFFSKLIKNELASDPQTHSLLRTTIAPTVIQAGVQDNVLPTSARLLINFRILPGETIESVIKRVSRIVHDKRVKIKVQGEANDPPKVSNVLSRGYRVLKRSIEQVYPEAHVVPGLNISTSDSRFFAGLTDNIFRFVPFFIRPGDPARFHGVNERMSIADYQRSVQFYYQLLLNTDMRSLLGIELSLPDIGHPGK